MPCLSEDVRALALLLPETVEGAHQGHPDFRVGGRIYATLWTDEERVVVKLAPETQAIMVEAEPDAFEPVTGSWGARGWTSVARSSHARSATAVHGRPGPPKFNFAPQRSPLAGRFQFGMRAHSSRRTLLSGTVALMTPASSVISKTYPSITASVKPFSARIWRADLIASSHASSRLGRSLPLYLLSD